MNSPKVDSTYSRDDAVRIMTSEEFDQVIEAIVLGRYSWACVLILRIAGYNPLHYLPYRTYRRLIKENSRVHLSPSQQPIQETELSNLLLPSSAKNSPD